MANAGFSVGTFTGGGTFFVESLSGTLTPVGIVAWGGSGTATRVVPTAAGALPVTLYAGTLNAGTVTVSTIAAGTVAISTIAAGTVVTTNTVTSVVGGGAEATAQRVTIANDSTGVLSVDDNGGSLTIDGTVTANLSATDNAVLDDIAAKLATIDADTSALAATVGGTELQVDIVSGSSSGTQYAEDAAHTTGDLGTMALAVRLDSAAAIAGTDGDYTPLQVDAAGALRVTGGGGGTEYVVDAAAPAAPTGTASLMERDDALSALTEVEGDWTNMRANANGALWTAVNGTVTVDGSGVTQPVSGTVTANLSATDNAVLDAIEVDTTTIAGAVSGTEMQVDVVAALPAGTATIGAVNVKPTTSGGLTIFRSIDLDESEEEVKASAGQLYGWYIFNAAATTHYVKLYNATAASTTVGTTTPILTIPVPAGAAANVEFTNGIAFSTALSAAATTGVADSDTGAPAANAVVVNLFYS